MGGRQPAFIQSSVMGIWNVPPWLGAAPSDTVNADLGVQWRCAVDVVTSTTD